MDSVCRHIILNNGNRLAEVINLQILKPFLVKHKVFTRSMLKDIYDINSDYNFFVELPTRGPEAFSKFIQVLKEAGYAQQAKILAEQATMLDGNVTKIPKLLRPYKMSTDPLGFCLIINNVHFDQFEERYGSEKDTQALHDIFKQIGFDVSIEKDLTGHKMRICLEKFSKHSDWKNVDSCIVVILSHGDNFNNLDVVYGTDSDYIEKNEIYEMFNNFHCNGLLEKPKIFIFQACRGKHEDDGVYSCESTDANIKIHSTNLKANGVSSCVSTDAKVFGLLSQESTDAKVFGLLSRESIDAMKVSKVSSASDVLAVHPALPFHVSYRDHDKGTWLCQDLVQVLSDYYLKYDLQTMLLFVNGRIQDRLSLDNKKQAIHSEQFGMSRKIYFFKTTDFEDLNSNIYNNI